MRACSAFLGLRSAITTLIMQDNATSVAQKLRIFTIKAIFDPQNSFSTNSRDDKIKIKAEIKSFNMRYYKNLIKLWSVAIASCDHQKSKLHTVASAEGFWVAELWVRQLKIGRKSCFADFS